MNYGRLPGGLFMINWPLCGNDYGEGVGRLVESQSKQQQFLQEALWHTQSFAHFIQSQLGRRYSLSEQVFPKPQQLGGGAYALHPYYRESRRLQGLVTLREQDILPITQGRVASLPLVEQGGITLPDTVTSIAIGNYANDHHYPGVSFPLQPKSIRWGGRWTGTPFTIPYGCLVPIETDGLLVCEKNISVSHIANGATRLQPVVMNIGQAAGMAAALCVSMGCQPRDLPVRRIQEALLQDPIAPAAIIPLFNLLSNHPDWLYWQRYYLDHPEEYPTTGNVKHKQGSRGAGEQGSRGAGEKVLLLSGTNQHDQHPATSSFPYIGIFECCNEQDYRLTLTEPSSHANQTWTLITLRPEVEAQLQACVDQQQLTLWGRLNESGSWLVVERIGMAE
jgi:hypothetical protein